MLIQSLFLSSLLSSPFVLAGSPWPTSMESNSTASSNSNQSSAATSTLSGSNSSIWNPSAANNPGTNARIPSSISNTCQAFLARLNSNTKVKACTAPLMNATASFSAGAQSVTPDQVQSAFDGLCGPSSGEGCHPELIHDILSHFAGNCSSELNAGQPMIRAAYDVLYIMTPFKRALCAQDPKTGDYCPITIASAVVNATDDKKDPAMSANDFRTMITSLLPSGKLVTQVGSSLTKRATAYFKPESSIDKRAQQGNAKTGHLHQFAVSGNGTTAAENEATYHPDPDAFTTTNLAFLFLNPSLPASALCTPCTVSVVASYIAFEEMTPHYGGLRASGFLSGQVKLWKGITNRCGADFAKSINDKAGIVNMMTTSDTFSLRPVSYAPLLVGLASIASIAL